MTARFSSAASVEVVKPASKFALAKRFSDRNTRTLENGWGWPSEARPSVNPAPASAQTSPVAGSVDQDPAFDVGDSLLRNEPCAADGRSVVVEPDAADAGLVTEFDAGGGKLAVGRHDFRVGVEMPAFDEGEHAQLLGERVGFLETAAGESVIISGDAARAVAVPPGRFSFSTAQTRAPASAAARAAGAPDVPSPATSTSQWPEKAGTASRRTAFLRIISDRSMVRPSRS